MIEAEITFIRSDYMRGLVKVVVRDAGPIRQRIQADQAQTDMIDFAERNNVTAEGIA